MLRPHVQNDHTRTEDNATVAKSREREKDRAQHLSHAFCDPFVPTPAVLMVSVGLEVGE